MKKLVLIVALILSVVSFASETEKNENQKLEKSLSILISENQKVEVINIFGWCDLRLFGYLKTELVFSLADSGMVEQETFVVTGGCLTCYEVGVKGTTVTVNCW